jgi:PAS domain S-box-containing protein
MDISDKRLYLGMGLLTAVLAVSGVLALRHTQRLRDDAAWVAGAHEGLGTLGRISTLVADAETGQRGFLLTHDPRYLQPYLAAVGTVRQEFQRVRELPWDGPGQRARVAALGTLIGEKLDELRRTIALEERDPEAARRMVRTHLGRNLMTAIRSQVNALEAEQRELLGERERQSRRSYLTALWSGSVFALLGVGLAVAFLARLHRHLRERAAHEQALVQQRQWFQVTLNSIGDAVIATDASGLVSFMNPVAEYLTGWDDREAVGRPLAEVFRIIHGETREPLAAPVEQVLRERGVVGLANPTLLVARDGRELPVEDSAAPITDPDGQVTGVVLVFHDAAEERRAEEALRRSEQRFRTLTELSPDAIWVNRDDRLELANQRAVALMGADRADQLLGLSSWDIFHPSCHAKVQARLEAARTGRSVYNSEELVVRLDGSLCPVDVSSTGFEDAQGPAVQVVLRDITEQRRRDAELHKLNRALGARSKSNHALLRSETASEPEFLAGICRIITEDCGHAMVWVGFKEDDPQRSIRPVAYAGFEAGYLEGLALTWADAERGRGATGTAIRTARPAMCRDTWTDPAFEPWRIEAVKRGYRSSLALPLVAGGEAFGAVTFYALEPDAFGPGEVALLEELTADVAYGITVHRLRREHAAAMEVLRESSRRKDEFLGTLAHELRNPLAPIRTGAYILASRPAPDPESRLIHEMIGRQATHMARLVDDLLQVARIEQGKLELRKERVELGRLLDHVLEACRPALQERRHRITLAVPEPAPALEADPVRLEQMLVNLVQNACKCTPPGGAIHLWAAPEGAEVALGVRDNGAGMTPEEVARAFDLFYQGRAGQGHGERGLGIGLTLVRRLAQLHGGSVAAASPGPGLGSEFVLRLPAAAEPAPAAVPAAPPAPARPRHVLLVDDDPGVRATSAMLLQAQGYRVSLAATGAKGIERARTLHPDIALIDLGMPDLDGCDVASRIRADLGASVHLVALTGYSRESDLARTREAGFEHHLVKSGDPRELLDLLSTL